MEIRKKESGRTGKFIVYEDDEEVADISWLVNDEGNYVIDHTTVSEKMAGKGLGVTLFNSVIDMARDENKKIIAGCPFVRKMFERNKEKYSDVWEIRD
jgi:predicted GNAT family acetyltransferase